MSVPTFSELRSMPARNRVLGGPASTIHSCSLASAATTLRCIQACGLIHSILVTLPRSSTGDLPSNSAAKAWWATACCTPNVAAVRRPADIAAQIVKRRLFMRVSSGGALRLGERRRSLQRLLPQVTVHQFFHEFDAPELLQVGVLTDVPVEVHAHLPRTGEHRLIGDLGFITDDAWARVVVLLDHLHVGGVEVAGMVEPARIVQAGDDDHEGVAFPMGD